MASKKPVTVKKATAVSTKAEVKAGKRTDVKQQFSETIEKARASSRETLLAGLGAIAKARKAREERFHDLVEEGKRFEPTFNKAIADLKAKLQPKDGAKFDLSKFKFEPKKFDRDAIQARLQDGLTSSLHRLGLPTRKEVDALAKKVEKLAEVQRA